MVDTLDGNISATAEVPKVDAQISAAELDQLPHSQSDIDLLYRIYAEKRIVSQIEFYNSRIIENERNADFTFAAGALVMTISSLVATISAGGTQPVLSLLATILPALAAVLASFRQLYGWERQVNIYRDALLGLERVRLLAPDNDRVAATSLTQIYPQLVISSETVFNGEVSQWGQFVLASEEAKAKDKSRGDQTLEQLVNSLGLNDDQRGAIQAIMSASKEADMNLQTNTFKKTDTVLQTQMPPAAGGNTDGGTLMTEIETTTETSTSYVPPETEGQPAANGQEAPSITEGETKSPNYADNPTEAQPQEGEGSVG